MKLVLFYTGGLGEAATAYAIPLRHREGEACDGAILMRPDGKWNDDKANAKDLARLKKLFGEPRYIEPTCKPWPLTDEEKAAMNPLNTLRHDAALLGITIDPAYDETALVALIRAKRGDEKPEPTEAPVRRGRKPKGAA
jgi:hypothetical protein